MSSGKHFNNQVASQDLHNKRVCYLRDETWTQSTEGKIVFIPRHSLEAFSKLTLELVEANEFYLW